MATDRTIPRHPRPRGRVVSPTYGWFVDYGDRVVLTDRRGNTWSPEYVSILQGGFGFAAEGVEKLPRPRKFDAQGKVVILGDQVIIDFLDGNPKRPLVRGGVRSVKRNDFLQYNHADGKGSNRFHLRVQPLDAAGAVMGQADLRIADDDKGSVSWAVTESFEVLVGKDPDRAPRLRLRVTGDTVTVDTGGTAQRVILGDTFLAELRDALTMLVAFLTTSSTATVAPQIAAAALTAIAPATAILNLLADLVTSTVGPGAPLLSKVTKTE